MIDGVAEISGGTNPECSDEITGEETSGIAQQKGRKHDKTNIEQCVFMPLRGYHLTNEIVKCGQHGIEAEGKLWSLSYQLGIAKKQIEKRHQQREGEERKHDHPKVEQNIEQCIAPIGLCIGEHTEKFAHHGFSVGLMPV